VTSNLHKRHKWNILPLAIADQQWHIEQSERLLAAASATDVPTLYWSIASAPGLVLGFSQKPEILNPAALAVQKIPLYHRRAGGTAVLAGPHLLSLDVVLPPAHPLVLPDLVESYRWFGEAWVAALAQLGIQARAVPPSEAHGQRALLKREETREREAILRRACFGSLSPYEVVVGQRKVVGFDMIRRQVGSLLQAGVLLHWEAEPLAQLLGHTPEEQAILREGLLERAVGLDTLTGWVVTAEEVMEVFEDVIQP
jgi:lipoate-protein ligase A